MSLLNAAILVEALPYIRRFAGRTIVVKYGGNALAGTSGEDALSVFATDIVMMRLVGMRPVVVHGGGPQISELMGRLGKTAEFKDGLRVTDAETVDIARMVLIGQVNPQIVSAINVHGDYAVGVSGEDGGLIRAVARNPELGFVGDISSINPDVLERLLDDEFIPVVATVGADAEGQAFNINADTVAGEIAAALGAKLVYLTDIDGLRRDIADAASLIRQTTPDELEQLISDGTIDGGMIPKVASCISAVRNGVGRAHILDGRTPMLYCSNFLPTPALARWSRCPHHRTEIEMGHTFDTDTAVGHCPFMPVFGPPRSCLNEETEQRCSPPMAPVISTFLPGSQSSRSDTHIQSLLTQLPTRQESWCTSATSSQIRSRLQLRCRLTVCSPTQQDVRAKCSSLTQVPRQMSGAELARKHAGPGRHKVVTALGSFHGRTLATLAATGQPAKHEPFAPMPDGFIHVPWGDLGAIEAAVDETVGAVFLESIQGEGGVNPAPDGYLEGVREICTRKGALMMIDEVQTGFARTGEWFGFEHSGVSPDVVTLAKAMGNGMPIGACWAPVGLQLHSFPEITAARTAGRLSQLQRLKP